MRRFLMAALVALGIFGQEQSVLASADGGDYPEWHLTNREIGFGNSPIIAPGNDTRANLLLLLQDTPARALNGSYRDLGWESYYGHNFFSWQILRNALYPVDTENNEAQGARYGTRCDSFASGTEAFKKAVNSSALISKTERTALSMARDALVVICEGNDYFGEAPDNLPQILEQAAVKLASLSVDSRAAKDFLAYLESARAFYGADFDAARSGFSDLTKSKDSWLKETSTYMIARTELNAAQANSFDQWGSYEGPESSDKAAVTRADLALKTYLKNYPRGQYAASADGLKRRVYWLAQDNAKLSAEYQRLLGQLSSGTAVVDLVEEIDLKLLFEESARSGKSSPYLLAVIDLMQMREGYGDVQPISLAELEQQRSTFADHNALYEFLIANHAFYVEGDARKVLQIIPDDARQENFSYLQFSRQALRGTALQMLKDRNEGGFWREMLAGAKSLYQRPTVELGLAIFYERNGQTDAVFAANSPIKEPYIRERLLQYVAGPELLRKAVQDSSRPRHERDVALMTLLHKQLTRGYYAAFLQDQKLVSADADSESGLWNFQSQETIPVGLYGKGAKAGEYDCPSIRETAAKLAQAPKDATGRLCLGDFLLANGFDGYNLGEWAPAFQSNEDQENIELGSSKQLFPGKSVPRQQYYQEIIVDPKAKPDERAYALYRAVYCYARTGSNSCGGEAVDIAQRKAWFQQLQRSYPNSKWAKKLKYYW